MNPKFDKNGLIPVITQQFDTGEVLTFAWMNAEALEKTLQTGEMVYFSRSRNSLWKKGETSGQAQILKEMRLDCDGDALLALVDQQGKPGVACHTGRKSCFYFTAQNGVWTENQAPLIDPKKLYE